MFKCRCFYSNELSWGGPRRMMCFYPLVAEFFGKMYQPFSITYEPWNDACNLNPSSLKTRFHLPYMNNTMAVGDMGLLPDTQYRGLRMRRECRERFPRHRLQRKPLVSDPGMHHGTCVTHVPWCMSGSLNCGGGGKRSRHSRRMRNSQFYVSGKRPMAMHLQPLYWFHSSTWHIFVSEPGNCTAGQYAFQLWPSNEKLLLVLVKFIKLGS